MLSNIWALIRIPCYGCAMLRCDTHDTHLRFPQALLLLGGVALSCLALDLLFLLFYSFWLCCRHRKSEEHLNADCCCTAWCVIIATLVCRYGWWLKETFPGTWSGVSGVCVFTLGVLSVVTNIGSNPSFHFVCVYSKSL